MCPLYPLEALAKTAQAEPLSLMVVMFFCDAANEIGNVESIAKNEMQRLRNALLLLHRRRSLRICVWSQVYDIELSSVERPATLPVQIFLKEPE